MIWSYTDEIFPHGLRGTADEWSAHDPAEIEAQVKHCVEYFEAAFRVTSKLSARSSNGLRVVIENGGIFPNRKLHSIHGFRPILHGSVLIAARITELSRWTHNGNAEFLGVGCMNFTKHPWIVRSAQHA